MTVWPRSRMVRQMVGAVALGAAGASIAAGTQLVRHARAAPIAPQPNAHELPQQLSVDALSQAEVDEIKQGLLAYLRRKPLVRFDGVAGCMQWLFLRNDANEPWSAVGYSLPSLLRRAVKINGALRTAMISYSITPDMAVGRLRGANSVPGTRPGSGSITVTSFARVATFEQWLGGLDDQQQDALRTFRGEVPTTRRFLQLAPVSNLRVASQRTRCTLLAADCRRYVSDVDDDARWSRPGGAAANATPDAMVGDRIPLAPGLRTQLAIEDMCPFSRLGMVEGAINTRAHPVERGIADFGLPGNASLSDALSQK